MLTFPPRCRSRCSSFLPLCDTPGLDGPLSQSPPVTRRSEGQTRLRMYQILPACTGIHGITATLLSEIQAKPSRAEPSREGGGKARLWLLDPPDQPPCRARRRAGQRPPPSGLRGEQNKPSAAGAPSSSEPPWWPPGTPLESSAPGLQTNPADRGTIFSVLLPDSPRTAMLGRKREPTAFSSRSSSSSLLAGLLLNAAPTGDQVATFLPTRVQKRLSWDGWMSRAHAGISAR